MIFKYLINDFKTFYFSYYIIICIFFSFRNQSLEKIEPRAVLQCLIRVFISVRQFYSLIKCAIAAEFNLLFLRSILNLFK